ncbi:hypothetical protein A8709_08635 [Paenibacillus pectinilyticus]|uniref:HAMP domain-containing protein n=1 Tax=Paenibacillus pectinilyticus TaxID=512399 RepID=A0A1C1A7Y4_9BACL|nr:histidine kinase [Paenibacillus pectinilyticus]OCT16720.1 hypothetical protein A8709_08635 [Paenibacillus pectinilyticus]
MHRITRRLSFNSLQVKLFVGVFILVLPLIVVLILGSQYAVDVVRKQVSDSYGNSLALYMNQVDAELDNVDMYLNGLVSNSKELVAINQAANMEDYSWAKISIFNRFSEDLVIYPSIAGFFAYTPNQSDFLSVQSSQPNYNETEGINQYITQMIKSSPDLKGFKSNNWEAHDINGQYYVIHILKAKNVYFGAWQKVDALAVPLNFIRSGSQGGSLFATSDGVAMTNSDLVEDSTIRLDPSRGGYYLSGRKTKFLVVGEPSRKGNFSLFALVSDEQILGNLPYFRWFASLVPLASILIIPLGLFFLRKLVLIPINRLLVAMKRIREGNLDMRIDTISSVSDEFMIVFQTFNSMMRQIQELTVNVYEEKLSKQQEELQRLQLQINPHFFLNSLNIIYHLAKLKDFALIKELSQCLIHYFRYMFRSNMTFVQLKDELKHTTNYLRIQELRFPGQLHYECKIPEYVKSEMIPPLFIQTFAENTVKHAVTLDHPVSLFIQADIVEYLSKPYLKIQIEDTGKGFDKTVLTELQANKSLANEQGEHIGIWNVQRRLSLLFGDAAVIEFANRDPHGAAVMMLLPMQQVEKDLERVEEANV